MMDQDMIRDLVIGFAKNVVLVIFLIEVDVLNVTQVEVKTIQVYRIVL